MERVAGLLGFFFNRFYIIFFVPHITDKEQNLEIVRYTKKKFTQLPTEVLKNVITKI